jgi:DNA mismatch endonuclease (patch repair protein)
MKRQRRRDTDVEVRLRSVLHQRGYRFGLHRKLIPGTRREVDIVLPRARLAIFVDGCFWHCCAQHGTLPKSNRDFWRAKLAANRARDADTDTRLRDAGWLAVRIWEHDDPEVAADRIAALVAART